MNTTPTTPSPATLPAPTRVVLCGRAGWGFHHYLPDGRTYVAGVVYDDGEAVVGRYLLLHPRMTRAEETHRVLAQLHTTAEPTCQGAADLLALGLQLQGC